MKNEIQTITLKDEERTRCEIWTRVMGYHRPIESFNVGKKGEVAERKYFVESKCSCTLVNSATKPNHA